MATPVLPDAKTVSESLNGWKANRPSFAQLLDKGMSPVDALARWSMELLRVNQTTEALAALRCALALAPGSALLWMNYGAVLNQVNSPKESAACLEHSLTLSREQPDTWVLLGMVRQKLRDPAAAETAYRTALEQEPKSIAAWQLLGLLKQEQRDYRAAAECLTACVKAGSADAALSANLGKLCYQLGQIPEAYEAYTRAVALNASNPHYRRMACKSGFLLAAIQGETIESAIANFQKSSPASESVTDKVLKDLLSTSFSQLSGLGHLEAAMRVGGKLLELWPDNPSVAYLLKAVAGDAALERSTPEYVVEYFDAFAEGFDAQLVDALGYDAPGKICEAVRKVSGPEQLFDTLDAGCGTGLCGPYVRSMSRALTGVDLSPRMLEQADKKGIYDALACEEVVSFMERSAGKFDLIVAADLLIYFGDLGPVFSSAATALRPGGLLAFSTESWTGEGYRVQPSGRFAQSRDYVRAMAAEKFEELVCVETTIRLDAGKRLAGHIFILRRK